MTISIRKILCNITININKTQLTDKHIKRVTENSILTKGIILHCNEVYNSYNWKTNDIGSIKKTQTVNRKSKQILKRLKVYKRKITSLQIVRRGNLILDNEKNTYHFGSGETLVYLQIVIKESQKLKKKLTNKGKEVSFWEPKVDIYYYPSQY